MFSLIIKKKHNKRAFKKVWKINRFRT